MKEFFTAIFLGLLPPRESGGNNVYRWRVTVSVMIMANTFVIVGLSALSFGMTPLFFHGFAQADGLAAVQQQFATIQTNQLDAKILDTRTRQCRAILSKNESALQFATERLQIELNDYQSLTKGLRYRLPGCEEL